LLETLPQLHEYVNHLVVANFALTRQLDVQELSNIILSKCETLKTLELESIECPVDDCYQEDSDDHNGFLDPLFYAASGLGAFFVSTKTRSAHSTLVSPRALCALIVEEEYNRTLRLNGLGLTDSHVLAIVDGLSTPDTCLGYLNLESNPHITAQGYGALMNLINRDNAVGEVFGSHSKARWRGFCLEDKAWEGKLNLVSEMNYRYHRLEYLTNGTFTSVERRWQWLESVVSLPGSDEYDEWYEDDVHPVYYENADHVRSCDEDKNEEKDAKHLNFIWYTLCENPEMIPT
jgi:hypothetical protein